MWNREVFNNFSLPKPLITYRKLAIVLLFLLINF
nr:MAG TPA: hypothetical protein [Caudoviricetes sp.]